MDFYSIAFLLGMAGYNNFDIVTSLRGGKVLVKAIVYYEGRRYTSDTYTIGSGEGEYTVSQVASQIGKSITAGHCLDDARAIADGRDAEVFVLGVENARASSVFMPKGEEYILSFKDGQVIFGSEIFKAMSDSKHEIDEIRIDTGSSTIVSRGNTVRGYDGVSDPTRRGGSSVIFFSELNFRTKEVVVIPKGE